jgi:hypothetical protein
MSGSDLMSPTQRIYPYHGGRGEEWIFAEQSKPLHSSRWN